MLGVAWAISLLARRPIDVDALQPAVEVAPETPSVVAIRRMLAAKTDLAIVTQNGKPAGVVGLQDLTEPLLDS